MATLRTFAFLDTIFIMKMLELLQVSVVALVLRAVVFAAEDKEDSDSAIVDLGGTYVFALISR